MSLEIIHADIFNEDSLQRRLALLGPDPYTDTVYPAVWTDGNGRLHRVVQDVGCENQSLDKAY